MSLYLGTTPIANDGSHRITGEIGDIGIAPLGIDESLNLRRYLNGQVISQLQFEAFTTKVKSAVALFPSLATTESNWQAEKALSKFGQVGKFVIDDENQTIRLPAVVNAQGLLGLSGLGNLVNESLPNISGSVDWDGGAQGRLDVVSADGAFTTSSFTSAVYPTPTTSAPNIRPGFSFNASRSSSTYQDNAPVQQEAIQYPYYIQVATGIEEELPAIREYKVNNSNFFGQSMYSENAPYNASWLASNGQYNAQSLYPDMYTQLNSVELNGSLNVGDTIEINGKTYVKRGLPVVLSTGTITDYDFVVNQDDQTFRLPLLNGEEDIPGAGMEPISLDTTATVHSVTRNKNGFYSVIINSSTPLSLICESMHVYESAFSTDSKTARCSLFAKAGQEFLYAWSGSAANLSSISTIRFTPAVGNGTLYFYVGDVVQDASLINAGAVLSDVVDLKQTALRTDQITNCITEIPQDIKLELNNGTLTLKAGSKVYVPNGFEADGTTPKFDTYIVPSDLTKTANNNDSRMYYLTEGKIIDRIPFSMIYSGGSAPTNLGRWALWYDTTNNIVKYTANSGSTWVSGFSFPFCSATSDTTSIVSIDQIFNGFGYIGSTVFALPGVKGLIPNGRNADGTLKNIEFTVNQVHLNTSTNAAVKTKGIYFNSDGTIAGISNGVYIVSIKSLSDRLSSWTGGYCIYVEDENRNYVNQNTNPSLVFMYASLSQTTTNITSFTPKQPFQAVDRNDSSWIAAQGMPSGKYIDLTLGASGSTYTAPANGYVSLIKGAPKSSTVYQYIGINNANYLVSIDRNAMNQNTVDLYVWIPVRKGVVFTVYYNATGETKRFRFCYAEGEN